MRKAAVAVFAVMVVMAGGACGEKDLGGAPDVRGLPLPDAKGQLKKAGFGASETSDALFGVVIEENFTVCDQDTPKGNLVPLKVSKAC